MLRRFAVENYRNFRGRTELDLTAVRNYSFMPQCVRDGLIDKAILLGKNGTGKTNLGFAIFDIVMTLTDNAVHPQQTDAGSFLNGEGNKEYATFEYEFQQDERIIRYSYRKTDPRNIVYEELEVDGKRIFVRDGNKGDYSGLDDLGAGHLRIQITDGPLSVVRFVNANTVQPVGSPLSFIIDFASRMLYFKSDVSGNAFIGYGKGEAITDYIVNNGLVDDFQGMLNEYADIDADIGVSNPIPGMPGVLVQKTKHKSMRFDSVASTGTRAFLLFYYWYKHMGGIKFLYMDEFDAYYHYEMSERIVRLITEMEGFQAILTTQNISFLSNDLVRPDCCLQIIDGAVRSFSNSTGRELRQGHNLEKMYRNGEFDYREQPIRSGRKLNQDGFSKS